MSRNAFPQIERDYAESLALREHAAMERREAMAKPIKFEFNQEALTRADPHVREFSHTSSVPPLAAEIDSLRSERDRLRRALARIAALDPDKDAPDVRYFDAETQCFRQAQDIAAEALK
jgi:hypothetical protein